MAHRVRFEAAQHLAPGGRQGVEGVAGADGRPHHLGRVEPAQQPVVPPGQPVCRDARDEPGDPAVRDRPRTGRGDAGPGEDQPPQQFRTAPRELQRRVSAEGVPDDQSGSAVEGVHRGRDDLRGRAEAPGLGGAGAVARQVHGRHLEVGLERGELRAPLPRTEPRSVHEDDGWCVRSRHGSPLIHDLLEPTLPARWFTAPGGPGRPCAA